MKIRLCIGVVGMKKYFAFLLSLIMLLIFTACSNLKSHCINCNTIISPKDNYCKNCGAKIDNNTNNNYKATTSVMITNISDDTTLISNKDIVNSLRVIDTCIELLKNRYTMQKIYEKLDFYISIPELEKSIQFNRRSDNSAIIDIIVSADTKEHADKILSCLLEEAPSVIENVLSNTKLTVLSID